MPETSALHEAMWSLWMHGDWRGATELMTEEQRDAAWAAVKQHHAATNPDAPLLNDTLGVWWRV